MGRFNTPDRGPFDLGDPDGNVAVVALALAAGVAVVADYVDSYLSQDKSFTEYYASGEYSAGRAAFMATAGAATGVLAATGLSGAALVAATAGVDTAAQTASDIYEGKEVTLEGTAKRTAVNLAAGTVIDKAYKILKSFARGTAEVLGARKGLSAITEPADAAATSTRGVNFEGTGQCVECAKAYLAKHGGTLQSTSDG